MPLLDPHSILDNGNNVDNSKLFYFVDLNVYKTNYSTNGLQSTTPIKINFLGAGANNLFTTDWTLNKENFGITGIQYKLNTSYVPQVDITFEDVRGQSLFNDFNNSKYKVIFDFPPPIFELTLKGYYGQAVVYKLHLLRINSKLKNNGSFEINASFVGLTFAPLADILFDYLEVAPFLAPNSNVNQVPAQNTITLVKAAHDLTAILKTTTDADRTKLNNINLYISQINTAQNNGNYVSKFVSDINGIDSVNQNTQNQAILASATSTSVVTIYLKYFVNKNNPLAPYPLVQPSTVINNQISAADLYGKFLNYISTQQTNFSTWGGITQKFPTFPNLSSIPLPVGITSDTYIQLSQPINFTGIDKQILGAVTSLTSQQTNLQKSLINTTQTQVLNNIKGGANLKNILGILLGDANTFYNALLKTVNAAQTKRGSIFPVETRPVNNIFATNQNNQQKVLTIPKDTTLDEVQFVDNYIKAKVSSKPFQLPETTFDTGADGNYKFVPINPFDSSIFNVSSNDIYTSANNSNIYDLILERGNVFLNQSYIGNIPTLITSYANVEAYHIIESLKINNPHLLQSLILNLKTKNYLTNTANFPKSPYVQSLNSSLNNITGATNNTVYAGGTNYSALTQNYFTTNGLSLPIPNTTTSSSSDSIITLTNNEIDNIGGNYISKLITNTFGGNNKILCQYNTPFYQDLRYHDTAFKIGFNTDFNSSLDPIFSTNNIVKGQSIKPFTQQNISTPDNFLNAVAIYNGRIIINSPFNHVNFNYISAIHEVPFFVLVWWGYVLLNYNTPNAAYGQLITTLSGYLEGYLQNWQTIPLSLQSIFISCYQEYSTGILGTKSMFALYQSDLSQLTGSTPNNFFASPAAVEGDTFFSKFTEIRYLVLGDTLAFNSKPLPKQINFSLSSKNQTKYNNYFQAIQNAITANESATNDLINKQTATINSEVDDNDIRTQLYYSFKSFAERWMLNSTLIQSGGTYNLFDVNNTFSIVDRGFKDIGNNIIMDLTPLWDTGTSPDTSLYTVLLNLLTRNNFEFFTLPTYIPYQNDGSSLMKIFGPDTGVKEVNGPKFICMYVGGTSAQLDMNIPKSVGSTSASDDGGTLDPTDPNSKQINDLINSPNITAFKIDFGTINQSFFRNIDLDQLEFKETNESIIMLDKIVNQSQGKDSTAIKGNNLFNVYQQRSYSCTVEMLGDVMIQPTMYFNLSNIALFKGAYLILEVNHTITQNTFTTKFKGVRIPQYPKPYVTDYSVIANIPLGSGLISTVAVTNTAAPIKAVPNNIARLNYVGNNNNPNLNGGQYKNLKAILDLIAYAEGTINQGQNGYDILFDNKLIPNWIQTYTGVHLGSPMFYGEPFSWHIVTPSVPNGTSAAGRYQFEYFTWVNPNVSKNDPSYNQQFNLVNQDARALGYAQDKFKRYGLDITQPITSAEQLTPFTDALGLIWAGFPFYGTITHNVTKLNANGWSPGKSYFTNFNGNGATCTISDLYTAFTTALSKYT